MFGDGLRGAEDGAQDILGGISLQALAEEATGHLGYDKHDPAGRGSGNSRNGTSGRTVLTDIGSVDLAVRCALEILDHQVAQLPGVL